MYIIRRMTDGLTDEQLLDLSEEEAERIYTQGAGTTRWALLRLSALARRESDKDEHPSTP